MAGTLFIVGTGPGNRALMTPMATKAIETSQAIVGYERYIIEIGHLLRPGHTQFVNGMGGETERVEKALTFTRQGLNTALVCGGDASLYALASLAHELAEPTDTIEVVPGITAALAASARLGAPVADDLAIISMSDLLTPWRRILARINAVNVGDFVAAIYNPRSKQRTKQIETAVSLFLDERGNLPVGIVKHCFRPDEEVKITTLADFPYDMVDMSTIVIVGNTTTVISNGKMITPRGYDTGREFETGTSRMNGSNDDDADTDADA